VVAAQAPPFPGRDENIRMCLEAGVNIYKRVDLAGTSVTIEDVLEQFCPAILAQAMHPEHFCYDPE